MPIVSIILINYNTFQLTCNCIESIIQFTKGVEYEIILVDNNSIECDANLFLQKFSTVILSKYPIEQFRLKSSIEWGSKKIDFFSGNYLCWITNINGIKIN